MQKDDGKIGFVIPIMIFMLLMVFVAFTWRMKIISSAKIQVADAITDANLAAAVVDTDLYGSAYRIENYNYTDMYNKYLRTLKASLDLDDTLTPRTSTYLASAVKIEDFWVYNVVKNEEGEITRVILHKVYDNGIATNIDTTYTSDFDEIRTPDGSRVESLTIYSNISFDVDLIAGYKVNVSKDESVDVVSNGIEITESPSTAAAP